MSGSLVPPALEPLPLATLRPAGWLRARLRLQADGMAGHLDEFWPDIARSGWIGGDAEGWERGPYWLDGIVGIAYLLDDPRLTAKVDHWVGYILDHQHEDGWFGPRTGSATYADHDVWPRVIVLKALLQYHDATGDPRVLPAALRFLRLLDRLLDEWPLLEWARSRWTDLVWVINQVDDLTGEPWLRPLAAKSHAQGYDWFAFADRLPYREKVPEATLKALQAANAGNWMNDEYLASHGVNVAMGLKAMPVWWRHTGDDGQLPRFRRMLDALDTHHGQASGLYSCDEHLAGTHPSQGTETCTVVEYLASLEVALEAWGAAGSWDAVEPIADRLEKIAFNALPASVSPDEWTHQYVQQANQVVCHVTEDRVYTNNDADANTFGLEPHFGCCTANRHQGWPRFTNHLWLRASDGGLTALSYAPCSLRTDDVQVEVSGGYPFTDEVVLTVERVGATVPLRLRVPAWSDGATLTVDGGEAVALTPGSVQEVLVDWTGSRVLRLTLPAAVRVVPRGASAVSVERGPLVYSVPVPDEWRQIGGEHPHASWEIHPTGPWNYALAVTPGTVAESDVTRTEIGDRPFSPEDAPIRLRLQGRLVDWGLEHGAAAAPPASPAKSSAELEDVELIPYGCTNLRVTEFPWTHVG
ncbi:DUF1680 family protein [Kribbella amoyensis]|uniref:DUF1680 family protein n=1 Tax=Kribbella amoyensis TaxID=996641 RepID=A0A561BZ73_9ACTN|nr:beta-L-arabinofuranosidase domain-containing protein [Kribbella amoyensis]TWD84107.1 DUF1680 family protein [Kribbella amoyensis]